MNAIVVDDFNGEAQSVGGQGTGGFQSVIVTVFDEGIGIPWAGEITVIAVKNHSGAGLSLAEPVGAHALPFAFNGKTASAGGKR